MRQGTLDIFEAWKKGKKRALATRALHTDGETIYSYGTAILAEVPWQIAETEEPGADNGDAVVLNRTTYSVTTTQHQHGLAVLLDRLPGLSVYEVGSQRYGVKPEHLVEVAYARA